MILSDRDIRAEIESGRITIDPYDERCVQPSSVDLHVDSQFRVFANSRYPYIDVREEQPDLTDLVEVKPDEPFILHPGEFVLGYKRSGGAPSWPHPKWMADGSFQVFRRLR